MRMIALAPVILVVALGSAAKSDPFWGAVDGAIDGAIIGGIIDGGEGAADGAFIGGTIGAVDGAVEEHERRRWHYRDRYVRPYYPPPRARYRPPNRGQARVANVVVEVQLSLRRLGYNPGSADGRPGRNTIVAVQRYQRDHGLRANGRITNALLRHMRSNGG